MVIADNPELADEIEDRIMAALREEANQPIGAKSKKKSSASKKEADNDDEPEENDIEQDDEELFDDSADDEFSIEEDL